MKSMKASELVLLSLLACVFALSACTDRDPVSSDQPAAALEFAAKIRAAKISAASLTKGGITLLPGHYQYRLTWTDDSIGRYSDRGVQRLFIISWASALGANFGHQTYVDIPPATHFTQTLGTSYAIYDIRVHKVSNDNQWYDQVDFVDVRLDNIQPTVKVGEELLGVSWTAEQFSGTPFQVQYRKPSESWPAARGHDYGETTQYEYVFAAGIDPSTTYQVRIRNQLSGDYRPWTEPVTVTTLAPIPAGASPEAAGSSGQPDWNAHPDNPPVIYVYAPKQALTDWYGSTDWQIDNIRYWVRAALLDSPEWAGNHIKASASGFLNPQYPIYLSNSSLVTGMEYEIRWEFRIGNDRSNILRVTTRATAR